MLLWPLAGWVPISRQDIDNAASVDFTGLDGTYEGYAVVGSKFVPQTDGTGLSVRVQVGGSFQTASYYYARHYHDQASTHGVAGSAAGSAIQLFNVWGNSAGENADFLLTIFGVDNAAVYKLLDCSNVLYSSTPNLVGNNTRGAYIGGVGAVTGLRFLPDGGNIASGKIALYALTRAL